MRYKQLSSSLILVMFFSIGFAQNDILNDQANSLLEGYLKSYNYEGRLKYVMNPEEMEELMYDQYGDDPFDISEGAYLNTMLINSTASPLLTVRNVPNYYKKIIPIGNGYTTYYFKLIDDGLLIDWMASLEKSEMTLKSYELRNPNDYVFMTVDMQLPSYKKYESIEDYFDVEVSDGSRFGTDAIIYKNSENSKILYDELLDGKNHKRVIWIKSTNWFVEDEYNPFIENVPLIGYINFLDNDSPIQLDKINLESPSLELDQQKYLQMKTHAEKAINEKINFEYTKISLDQGKAISGQSMVVGRVDYKLSNLTNFEIKSFEIKFVWKNSEIGEVIDESSHYVSTGELRPNEVYTFFETSGKGYINSTNFPFKLTVDIYFEQNDNLIPIHTNLKVN